MTRTNHATLRGLIIALACLAAPLVFAGVAFTEIEYVSDHPHAYPAKVIAYASGAGAILAVAVALLARVVAFRER